MKVLVIGSDGMSPILVEKWIEKLPTLRKIKKEGILGKTIPPIPAQTPVAWTTFMTGVNPGKHGIFSFTTRKIGTYKRKINTPDKIKTKTLWKILSEHGKRVGVINVPMSRTENLNGFIIPGFLAKREGIPYPSRVREKLRKKFKIKRFIGDVETKVLQEVKEEPDKFFERVNEITDMQADISLFLLEEEKWDFFMTVFMGTDRIQHFFWKNVDENHPEYERNEFTFKVEKYYQKMDKIISEFLKNIDLEETFFIFLSDHGFCPVHSEVLVNCLLYKQGFAKGGTEGNIDDENSIAVAYEYGDIWLNLEGREPNGKVQAKEYNNTVQKIKEHLEKIEVDGQKIVKNIVTREVYWGPYVNDAPDLIILFNPGWQASRSKAKKYIDGKCIIRSERWSGGHDGTHDPKDVPGILALLGSNVSSVLKTEVNLYDLTPTVLKVLEVSVPSYIDGKPIWHGDTNFTT